ncbi:MAG: dienelactone hydrolase family protein [Sphingomonadales bacterium]
MPNRYHEHAHDGVTCELYVSAPEGAGRRPAVLVAHNWAGQGPPEREAADRLAALGYVGIAVDVYGKGRRGAPGEDNSALMAPFMADRALLRDRLLAAIDAAAAMPEVDPGRIAFAGYCFGGLCALDVARSGTDKVKGAISLHGVYAPPGLGPQGPIRASVLVLHGWEDPMTPPADVLALAKELTEAGADWSLHAYGHAMHAFTYPGLNMPERGVKHDEKAERRSWQAMVNFLEEVLA